MRGLIVTLLACLALATPAAAQTRSVAVTFDDLPWGAEDNLCDAPNVMARTRDFTAMLKPFHDPLTAFVNEGKVCDALRPTLLPKVLNAWLGIGADIGNHTFSHINIHKVTAEAYLADVDKGALITRPLLAKKHKTLRYFRHPYLFTGETPEKKAAMADGLKARGYTVAPVTLDTYDWMFAAVYRQAQEAGDKALMQKIGEAYIAHTIKSLDHFEPYSAELTGGREPAQVLLLHANALNRDWYPKVYAILVARGYRFVSLDEALKDPVYGLPENWVRRNGISWLHRWTQAQGRKPRWEDDPPDWIVKAYEAKP